ncbi:MAG TPA: tetratricopeptide repeat protein, partial [Bacteroidota bacterium]|nr:tetratricopeptide repeat protein [Bacteroidota bacterium]
MFRAILLFLAAIPGPGRAGTIDWQEVHAMTLRGIDRLYDMKIDEASATFDSVRRAAPGDPRGYFFGSMVHFWRYTLTREEKEYRTFLDGSDEVITICENLIDRNPDDAVARFYLGGIYGYRGLAHQANNSIFKAVTDGRKGYMELKAAVALKSDLYDAQMGFGLFTYLVARVPKSLSWVLSLVGFSGDAAAGLAMVRSAAEHGVYTRTEARFFLSQFLFAEQKGDEALALLDTLTRDYPDNALFLVTMASWQSRLGNPAAALGTAEKAAAVNARNRVHVGEEFIYSTLGSIYFALNDFARARTNLERYTARVASEDYLTNWTLYRLGIAEEFCGDRQAAIATYRRMKKGSDGTNESYLYRTAQARLREPLTGTDALLIRAGNDLQRKDFDSARVLYGEVLGTPGLTDDVRGRALAGVQQIAIAREDYAGALRAGEELALLKPERETWILPQAYLLSGIAYAKTGNEAAARASLERALGFDDYDFQKQTEERARRELRG